MWTIPPWADLEATLRDPNTPIGKRMRAAYFAKTLFVNQQQQQNNDDDDDDDDTNNITTDAVTPEAIVDVLCEQVFIDEHGGLLRHEFAYVLGQMQTERACPTLHALLQREGDDVMVRHEAAEALGAIASPSSRQVLEDTRDKYKGTLDELSDTCLLALNRVLPEAERVGDENGDVAPVVGCACMMAPYSSIDPASADPKHVALSNKELGDILLHGPRNGDTGSTRDGSNLTERYRAMFSLRNRGGEEAVVELCRALTDDTSSALLRHEVAFVLGQLQHPASIAALEESLSRLLEHTMVRHESAEALGAIECESGEQWQRIEGILTKYQQDDDLAVAESCIVALDAADYFGHSSVATEATNDNAEASTNEVEEANDNSLLFGKQKHNALEDGAGAPDEIRKHILAQHFNVRTTANKTATVASA